MIECLQASTFGFEIPHKEAGVAISTVLRLRLDINLSEICGLKDATIKGFSQLKELDLHISE